MAKVVKLILTYDRRGIGRDDDPVRMCPQLFTFGGKLVGEMDPCPGGDIANRRMTFYPEALYEIEANGE